jgi:ribosomal protein S8
MSKVQLLLNNIKIGYKNRCSFITVLTTTENLKLLQFFFKKNWIKQYVIVDNKIRVYLRYLLNKPLFNKITIISTSGHRKYVCKDSIKYLLYNTGSGSVFINTALGLLSLKECRNLGIGGEVVFVIYY